MENSLSSPHLYNTSYQTPDCDTEKCVLYDGLYGFGAQNQLVSSSPLYDTASSMESLAPLSGNRPSISPSSYPGLHRPARLDWHQIGEPLGKNLANDAWLKTRRALAVSDSEEDTESLKEPRAMFQNTTSKLESGYNGMLESLNSFPVQKTTSLPTTPTRSSKFNTTYTISKLECSAPSPETICLSPPPSRSTGTMIISREQSQPHYTYLVLHDAVPVAAEALATTTVTGVYTTLEDANGFVEKVAEETCRDVPEEHFRLLVEEDGGFGFDILDMERHMLHRVHIEKQTVRGSWSGKTEIEKTGVIRSQVEDAEFFDELAKLSL